MNWFRFEKIKLKYIKRFFLESGAIAVRLPLSLNVVGKIYHLETTMISREYIYLKVYEEDFEFLPSSYSHLILFMNLDLFSNGKFDLEGKLVSIDKLTGSRLGLWISYQAETEKDKTIISEFVRNHYTPRYSVRFDVDIKTETKFLRAEAINLSEKGIFIEAPLDQLEERDACVLTLYPENRSISVKAEVSWINKGKMYDKPNGYGLKFIHDKKTESKIIDYLNLLKDRSEILR
jgi:hypothetical protein